MVMVGKMKKLLHKFYNFMYRYHRRKFYKYFLKTIGSKRYKTVYSLIADTNELADIKKAFQSGETHANNIYADTDSVSVYPSVMKPCRFLLVNQPGSK